MEGPAPTIAHIGATRRQPAKATKNRSSAPPLRSSRPATHKRASMKPQGGQRLRAGQRGGAHRLTSRESKRFDRITQHSRPGFKHKPPGLEPKSSDSLSITSHSSLQSPECTHGCAHSRIHTYMHIPAHTHTPVHTRTLMHTHVHTHTHSHMHTHVHACTPSPLTAAQFVTLQLAVGHAIAAHSVPGAALHRLLVLDPRVAPPEVDWKR